MQKLIDSLTNHIGDFELSDGTRYRRHLTGVIEQLNPEPFTYDESYIETYDSPEYKENSKKLNSLRLEFVRSLAKKHGKERIKPQLLDYGYGRGEFLKHTIMDSSIKTYGYDIGGYPVPSDTSLIEKHSDMAKYQFDIVTFWDSLEHCHSISWLRDLPAKMIVISLPYCHMRSVAEFEEWKHRKPNEHIWHFDAQALVMVMFAAGYKVVAISDFEDQVRRPEGPDQNILTAAFIKENAHI